MVHSCRELLTPLETAELLAVHPQTLKNWRDNGIGPPYVRFNDAGHIRYPRLELDAWLDSQKVVGE